VPLLDQEEYTLPEHMSSFLGFSGVRVAALSFGHCSVCAI